MVSILPKFKVWHIEDKCWLDIASVGFGDKGKIWYLEYYESDTTDNTMYLFIEDLDKVWRLVKSTNLKDKNGTEIYEGDIVKHDPVPNPYISNEHFEIIRARSGEWRMDNYRGGQVLAFSNHEVGVVGNRFEHPNLLGED